MPRSASDRRLAQELHDALGAESSLRLPNISDTSEAFLPEADLVDLVAEDPINLGWMYQFWNEPERDDTTWGVSRAEECAGVRDIARATQVFTDDYLARFLIARCLEGAARYEKSISLLDPACGTGHIIAHAIRTLGSDSRMDGVGILTALRGCDVDANAVEVCRLVALLEVSRIRAAPLDGLWTILQRQVQPLAQTYGSLDRGSKIEMLQGEHSCVITNPPYIGRRKMPSAMREYLDAEYPDGRMDLCSAFMQRCVELLAPGGMLGLVTVDKWLRLRGYETLRTGGGSFGGLYNVLELDVVCELGPRAFNAWSSLHDGVGTALLTARRGAPRTGHEFDFISIAGTRELTYKARALDAWLKGDGGSVRIAQDTVREMNRSAEFVSRSGLPQGLTSSRRVVSDCARVLVGLQTSDDRSYVRYVWSVPPDKERWLVHCKGGGYERWYGLNHFLLDWRGGRPVFERDPKSGLSVERWFSEEGWTYSWFANGALGLRRKERGWSFGRAASSALFCEDPRLIAFLNSRVASLAVRRQGGKAQLPEGVVRSLPIPQSLDPIDPVLVSVAVGLKRQLVERDITDATFQPDLPLDPRWVLRAQALLLVVEGELERQVDASVSLSDAERRSLNASFGGPVAWNPCVSVIEPDEIFSGLSNDARARLLACEAPRDPSRTLEEVRARVQSFFEGRVRTLAGSQGLPVTSLVERVCRWSNLHPFDVERALSSMLKSDEAVRREVVAPLVRSKVIGDILTLLGHQWWSATERYDPALHQSRSVGELARIITEKLPGYDWRAALGDDLEPWIATQAVASQMRLLRNTPLISIAGARRARDATLSHTWMESQSGRAAVGAPAPPR